MIPSKLLASRLVSIQTATLLPFLKDLNTLHLVNFANSIFNKMATKIVLSAMAEHYFYRLA